MGVGEMGVDGGGIEAVRELSGGGCVCEKVEALV